MTTSEGGKQRKAAGMRFERKVRADLEKSGWIVDKWTNNVSFDLCLEGCNGCGNIHPAKSFRGITRQNGFPDFIAFRIETGLDDTKEDFPSYHVIGVEVKSNGILSKIEKEKCSWYLENNIFSKILIASKKGRSFIVYK